MKGMGWSKVYCLVVLMPMLVAGIAPMVRSQPFLNSLAVLFRSRPPWPTTFPSSSKFPSFPSSLLSSQHPQHTSHLQGQQQFSGSGNAGSSSLSSSSAISAGGGAQHGILVAQPIVQSNNYDGHGSGGSSTDVKKVQENGGYAHQSQGSGQQGFVQVPSNPTLSPPNPVYSPPMSMFHTNPLGSTRGEAGGGQGGSSSNYNSASGESGGISSNGPKTLSDLPNLVASPSTINGNVVFPAEPPTALSNPFFGMLYDHNMKPVKYPHLVGPQRPQKPTRHHGRKHKPGFRLNPWNPTHMLFNHLYHGNRENLVPNSSNEKEVLYEENKSEQLRKQKKLKDFRPSPQLSSFVETTVITDYASHTKANNQGQESLPGSSYTQPGSSSEKDSTKYTSFDAGDARTAPKFESGFRPISFDQYAANYGTTATRPHYTNSQTQYFNPWSLPYDPSHSQRNVSSTELSSSKESKGSGGVGRGERKIVGGHVVRAVMGGGGGGDKGSEIEGTEEEEGLSTSEETYNPLVFFGNRGKIDSNDFGQNKGGKKEKSRHGFSSKGKNNHHGVSATISSTTASSELVEEWLPPGIRIEKKSDGREKKFSSLANGLKTELKYPGNVSPQGVYKLPDKCEKFKKYGFCPVTRQYPLDAAERIATRCSALLSHLIAPLPKVDVQYEVGGSEGGNGSNSRGGSWSWKTFQGKPICDTDEITTVPGWAKNENGDWMIILQTKLWQQKAHISLCSPVAKHCEGSACPKSSKPVGHRNLNPKLLKDLKTGYERMEETKCVQRFTAQRLAVFDPDNHDRCPVVRSVFLPSACVCLSKTVMVNETEEESRSSGKVGHSNFPARQPLFSSLEEESGDKVRKDEDEEDSAARASTLEQMSYPSHSKEALIEAQDSLIAGMPLSKLPRFKVIRRKKMRAEERQTETPRPVFTKSPNATYMIISEKYTTSEASQELPIEGDTKLLENYGGKDAENDERGAGSNGHYESDLDKETEEVFRSHPTIITSVKVNRH